MEVGVLAGDARGVRVGEALDALVAVEMVLDRVLLARVVDPEVGVGAVAVHVPVGPRDPAITHQVGHLVGRLGVEGPEVPLHVVVAQPGAAASLLRADEVRELHRVADEEDRRVVADEVVVALGRVELQREPAWVPPGVGGALLTGYRGEAGEHLGGDAGLEQRRLGERRHVVGRRELPERAGALGVHVALGHPFAVEVGHLVQEVHVVQQDRAVGAEGQRVPVARRGGPGVGGRAEGRLLRGRGRDRLVVAGRGQVGHELPRIVVEVWPYPARARRSHRPAAHLAQVTRLRTHQKQKPTRPALRAAYPAASVHWSRQNWLGGWWEETCW